MNALERKLDGVYCEKDDRLLSEMVWTYVDKASRSPNKESSPIVRDRGRSRKIIRETIKRDIDFNSSNVKMIYDGTLWHRQMHVANPI